MGTAGRGQKHTVDMGAHAKIRDWLTGINFFFFSLDVFGNSLGGFLGTCAKSPPPCTKTT